MFSFVKIFFILIVFLFITSCHEKDYDIIKDFIMKDQQVESSKNLDTLETDKTIKANVENKKKEASGLAKKDKQADSLETKIPKKKKFQRVDKGEENKELVLKNIQPKRATEKDDKNKEESSALGSLGLKPKLVH